MLICEVIRNLLSVVYETFFNFLHRVSKDFQVVALNFMKIFCFL